MAVAGPAPRGVLFGFGAFGVSDARGLGTGTVTFNLYSVSTDASAAIIPGGGFVALATPMPGQDMWLTLAGPAGSASA